MREIKLTVTAELCAQLGITDSATDAAIAAAIIAIAKKAGTVDDIQKKLDTANTAKEKAEKDLTDFNAATVSKDVETILVDALTAKKITKEMKLALAADYATNPAGLKALVDKMPAYQSITGFIGSKLENVVEANWKWEDYEKNDPSGKKLKALMTENPTQYKALFDERFLRERE